MKHRLDAFGRCRTALAGLCLAGLSLAPLSAVAQTAPPGAEPPATAVPATPPPGTYPPEAATPTPYPQGAAATYPAQNINPQTVSPSASPGMTLAGASISAVLSSPDINTKSAKAGDGFTMVVVPPYPGGDQNYAQATIHGHVADVTSAGQGRKAALKLAFDSITFASGQTQPLSGSIVTVESKSENTTARQAVGAGAGAAVGSQTIGRILGGAFGSLVGILGGAVGGFLYGSNTKANFDVATGAKATIQTTTPIEVPRRQAPAS